MEFLKKLLLGNRYYWDLLEHKPGRGSGLGPRAIAALPPPKAITVLIAGAKQHHNPYVRTRCIMLLDGYEVSEEDIETVRKLLRDDASAQVRHAAIGFFGHRAVRNRPAHAVISDLLRVLETPGFEGGCSVGDDMSEVGAAMSMQMAAASALKQTVGAKQIIAPFQDTRPGIIAQFKEDLRRLAEDPSQDPVMREDAQLYLRMI